MVEFIPFEKTFWTLCFLFYFIFNKANIAKCNCRNIVGNIIYTKKAWKRPKKAPGNLNLLTEMRRGLRLCRGVSVDH